ncbi:MAG: DUF5686 family protein [Gemmatimonadetes bacterium]|nr:DUF5686 family protein [Gemmatimonadota bacterium]
MFPPIVIVWFAFFLLGYCAADSQAEVVVQGVVLDAETGEALPRANIEVVGQAWGTIGDGKGAFRLVVDALPVTLRATHIGYAPAELLVAEAGPLEFRLQPIPFEIEGLIINGGDPAVRIMREVIRRKRAWAPLAHRYRVEAHTRQILYSNQYIAAIRESLAELYRDRDKGLREQLKAKKHTANVSASMQVFAASKYLFNLYDDEIALHGQIFTGPTHPQALEHYSFQLVGHKDNHYFISIQPKTNALAGWTGALVVQDGEYALVEAQLWPNRRLHPAGFATENGLGYRLRQHFAHFAHGAWLPVETEYEIEGRLGTTTGGERIRRLRSAPTPQARLRGWTWLKGYEFDAPSVDYAFAVKQALLVEPHSPTWDKFLDKRRAERPLTRREVQAVADLQQGFKPLAEQAVAALYRLHEQRVGEEVPAAIKEDPLARKSLINDELLRYVVAGATGIHLDTSLTFFGQHVVEIPAAVRGKLTPELWVNRVDALHFGARWRGTNLLGQRTGIYFNGGYNTGHERFFAGVGSKRIWGADGRIFTGLYYQRGTVPRYPSSLYTLADNSYPFLLSLDDYFDFYWRTRWRAEAGYRLAQHSVLTLAFNREQHRSLRKETDFSFCNTQSNSSYVYKHLCADRNLTYRDNPPIRAGRMTSLELALDLGGLDPKTWHRTRLSAEYSDEWMGSFARFARLDARLDWHVELARGRLWPAESNYRLQAGAGLGQVPIQRHGTLDAGLVIVAPFGAFKTLRNRPYTGRHYAGFFWEQRWRTGLFERLGLGWRAQRWGLGWALHGAAGRVWEHAEDPPTPLHHELGLSLTLLDYLNVEYTRRLDRQEGHWGLSAKKAF